MYANAESHYDAFRIAKNSLISKLEETCKDDAFASVFAAVGAGGGSSEINDMDGLKIWNNIRNGNGTADYKQFEKILAAQNDEEAI